MAKHEFGIMAEAPRPGERYDTYEPERYNCISVDDEDLNAAEGRLSTVACYWHTLAVKEKGLTWCGITLLPPESLSACIDAVAGLPALGALKELLEKAREEGRWVIHYGL